METLERMRLIALTIPGVKSAKIDAAEMMLHVSTTDGLDYSVAPNNLDLTLAGLDDEDEKNTAVIEFMARIADASELPEELNAADLPFIMAVVTTTDLAAAPGASDFGIWYSEIAPGLSEFLVIDSPESVSYITMDQIQKSRFSVERLSEQARQNLRKLAPNLTIEEYSSEPWVAGMLLDGFYECSLMLLPEIWSTLATSRGRIAASCPARGELLIFLESDHRAQESVGAYGIEAVATKPYPGSAFLYVWTGSGWDALP
jgi:hypothetical protein